MPYLFRHLQILDRKEIVFVCFTYLQWNKNRMKNNQQNHAIFKTPVDNRKIFEIERWAT